MERLAAVSQYSATRTRMLLLNVMVICLCLWPACVAGADDGNTANVVEDKHVADRHTAIEAREVTTDNPLYTVLTESGNVTSKHPCHLHPYDPQLFRRFNRHVEDGAKMVEMHFKFPEYDGANPLLVNATLNYRSDKWYRTTDSHGRTLLTLAFNYDILSLQMLTFGVDQMDIEVVDSPAKCFGMLSEDERIERALDLILHDFKVHDQVDELVGADPHACHEVIEDHDGAGKFIFRCCRKRPDGVIECTDNKVGKWVKLIYILIVFVKVIALAFGPVILQKAIHSESIRKTDYIIKLPEPLSKTILVKKVKIPDAGGPPSREMRQFRRFRRTVKSIPSEEIVPVTFEKLQIQVDQRRLMSEKSVPVGVLNYIYENIFRCRLRNWDPFATCCQESIFGTWSPKFLWINLKKNSECNVSCRKCLSWGHLAVLIGGLLLMAAIPLPYYGRLVVYYEYEEDELENRKAALDQLDLNYAYNFNLLHYLTPTHGIMWIIYFTYFVVFLLLAALRNCNPEKFDNIAVDAMQDLRHINRSECFRLIIAHLVLPLEKFGLCGVLVGAIYWPIAVPICLVVAVSYCIPALYLTGRFLIKSRPDFILDLPLPSSPTTSRKAATYRNLSNGISSFETCLLLNNISPEWNETSAGEDKGICVCCKCQINKHRLYTACVSWMVGLLCILFMYSILFLFAEVVGFFVEMFVFTLMGAIVNAGSAARYVMLAFWMFMYSTSCYNNVYEKYLKLNSCLFDNIKSHLANDIKTVTVLREDKQKNTAFKYFSYTQVCDRRIEEVDLEIDSDDEDSPDVVETKKAELLKIPDDNIEYIDDKLHWRLHTLVFFVDHKDVPRIPKELFMQICDIKAPGCPGPIYQSLLVATRQLMYMVIFLLFVLIVVMAFGDVYKVSSTNQILITLAGGFIPFVVRFVLKPKQGEIALSSYSFEGKVHEKIRNFCQIWPVFDLTFTVQKPEYRRDDRDREDYRGDSMDNPQGGDPGEPLLRMCSRDGSYAPTLPLPGRQRAEEARRDPTHVDLLITIRDDCYDETDGANLRTDPVDGSHGSLNSPEEGNAIQPTNVPVLFSQRNVAVGPDGSNESRRRPMAATQTSRPPSLVSSTTSQTSPGGTQRPVDLMVDMVKGSVRLRNPSEDVEDESTWSRDSPYNRMDKHNEKESESSV